MAFTPAVKEAFTLKFAIAGIAGVGKSLTSFQIARELAGGERFAVIDTENRKSRKYADEFQFDASDLEVFSIGAYTKEIKAAEAAGYKVLVIDGLSQMWEGKGGIKEMVEMIAKRDKISSFSAWQSGNAILSDFIKQILESPLHIICTMRSKTEYSSEANEKGKLQYRRIGLAPIQKDNLEFEFDLFAEMDHEHHMIFQKSLCRKLSGKVLPMEQEGETKRLVAIFKKWMEGATHQPELARAETSQSQHAPQENDPQGPITEQQRASMQKLYQHLGKAEPAAQPATYQEAKDLIAQLSQEYRQRRSTAQK